ncbi:MAG TPA: hypothetical protein PKC65_00520 [Pyrinomonadaceae bacterium]|nr:hypothetical protein [Pyrinomonadaceae bacterium]
MRSRAILIAIIVVLAAAASAFAERVSIRTADGYLFIQNGEKLSFACEVKGKDIKPNTDLGNPGYDVDGHVIQLLFVVNANFDPSGKTEAGKLLALHRDWEVDYLKSVFGPDVAPKSETVKLADRDVLFWNFNRPKFTTDFDRDAFATTLLERDIFGVSTPVAVGEELSAAKERLLAVMRTLKTSDKPYDIQAIAAAIKKGETPKL